MSDRDTEDLGALRAELATALARARKAERERDEWREGKFRSDGDYEAARDRGTASLAREARLREAAAVVRAEDDGWAKPSFGALWRVLRSALSDTTADAWLAERDGRTRDAALAEVEAMLRHESAEWASHNIALGYQASADRVAAMRRKP